MCVSLIQPCAARHVRSICHHMMLSEIRFIHAITPRNASRNMLHTCTMEATEDCHIMQVVCLQAPVTDRLCCITPGLEAARYSTHLKLLYKRNLNASSMLLCSIRQYRLLLACLSSSTHITSVSLRVTTVGVLWSSTVCIMAAVSGVEKPWW